MNMIDDRQNLLREEEELERAIQEIKQSVIEMNKGRNKSSKRERLEKTIQEIKQLKGCLAQNAELLKARKLVLLVDLDNTLIYTSNTMERQILGVKDVVWYQLGGEDGPWKYTRLRPHVKQFLRNISPLFEMRICTMGNRQYAEKMADLLNDDALYFAHHQILSREDITSRSKTEFLRKQFPHGDHTVVIIDDREDKWNSASNLIRVQPFHGHDDDYLIQLEALLREDHSQYFAAYEKNFNEGRADARLPHTKSIVLDVLIKAVMSGDVRHYALSLKRKWDRHTDRLQVKGSRAKRL